MQDSLLACLLRMSPPCLFMTQKIYHIRVIFKFYKFWGSNGGSSCVGWWDLVEVIMLLMPFSPDKAGFHLGNEFALETLGCLL